MQKTVINFRSIEICPICKDPFDESERKYPRVMACGHSVCSECIKNQVWQKQSVKCPSCSSVFSKEECVLFKMNDEYINLIQFLEESFGKSFPIYQKVPSQQNEKNFTLGEQPRMNQSQLSQTESFGEAIKCKNPACLTQTDLIFCSAECQAQFDEIETKKNEGGLQNRRSSY